MFDSLTSRRDKQKHIVSLGLEEQVIEDRYMNKSCVPQVLRFGRIKHSIMNLNVALEL